MSRNVPSPTGSAATEPPLRPPAPAGLLQTLIGFEEAPGRYAVVLREPRLLFDHQLAVMQLAAGRELPEFAERQRTLLAPARRAARFFVRTVMLKPGADHYSLLGLTPGFEPPQLREHYRLMIRLTHPDFASPDEAWPADAAARINIANDVMGSAVKRREYHEQWAAAQAAAAPKPAPRGAAKPGPTAAPGARPMPSVVPRRLAPGAAPASPWAGGLSLQHKVGMAAGGALMIAGLFLWLNGTVEDKGSLRVRAPQEPVAQLAQLAPTSSVGGSQAEPMGPVLPPNVTLEPSAELAAPAPPEPAPKPVAAPAPAARAAALAPAPEVAPTPPPPLRRDAFAERAASTPATTAAAPVAATATATARATEPLAPAQPKVVSDWVFPRATAVNPGAAGTAPPPAPVPAPSPPPAPPPAAQPTPVALAPASPPKPPKPPGLMLADVQPTLAKVVKELSDQRLNAALLNIPRPLQDATANRAFAREFYQYLAGQRVAELNNATFRTERDEQTLVVLGVLSMLLEDSAGNRGSKDLHIQAHFDQQNGQPVLTRLVARNPNP